VSRAVRAAPATGPDLRVTDRLAAPERRRARRVRTDAGADGRRNDSRSCLARHEVQPDLHVQLGDHGVERRKHHDHDADEAIALTRQLSRQIDARWKDHRAS
jgi:uncharacterized metal-binding protein